MTNIIGHGHVIPRDDGYKAECGGIVSCPICISEWHSDAGKEYRHKQSLPKLYTQADLDAAVAKEREECGKHMEMCDPPIAVTKNRVEIGKAARVAYANSIRARTTP